MHLLKICTFWVMLLLCIKGNAQDVTISKNTLYDYALSDGSTISSISFSSNLHSGGKTPKLYQWSIDGGSNFTAGSNIFTPTFSADGNYLVKCKVEFTDGTYLESSNLPFKVYINVRLEPQIEGAISKVCAGDIITLKAILVNNSNNQIISDIQLPDNSYQWATYGSSVPAISNTIAQTTTASFTNVNAGNVGIGVKYNFNNLRGITFAYSPNISISVASKLVISDITANDICSLSNISFDYQHTGGFDSDLYISSWNFGDGQSISTESKSVAHTFSSANQYQILLTIASKNSSCKATFPKKLLIGLPTIEINHQENALMCTEKNIQFNATISPSIFNPSLQWLV